MNAGTAVYWLEDDGGFYFRADTMSQCTHTAKALLERGLVEKCLVEPFEHRLRPVGGLEHIIRIRQERRHDSQHFQEARRIIGLEQTTNHRG